MCQFLGLSVGPRTFAYSLPFGTAIGSGRTLNEKLWKNLYHHRHRWGSIASATRGIAASVHTLLTLQLKYIKCPFGPNNE